MCGSWSDRQMADQLNRSEPEKKYNRRFPQIKKAKKYSSTDYTDFRRLKTKNINTKIIIKKI
jgi:hypothetical protein